jgi:hypothetical protein
MYRSFYKQAVLFFFVFGHYMAAYTQQPDMRQKINVNYNDVPFEFVLRDISQKTNIQFSYNPGIISLQTKINLKTTNKPVEKVLEEIFAQAGVQYSIVNEYFVLKPRIKEKEEKKPPKQEFYTISGTITDSVNNEFLIGASVYIRDRGIGTLTNNYGYFSLTLPEGLYAFETSYLGYMVKGCSFELKKNITWNIALKPLPFNMEEITVTAAPREEIILKSHAANDRINPADIRFHAAPAGETDMLKTLDNMPGISFQNDGSSYFNVRGGNRDQNLILIDEAPVFNPSHLLGFYTPIIPEAVKNAEIYKASFPVEFGGRLSSVIDIRTRDGNMQRFSGSAGIGFITSRLSAEGPFKKNKSSYFISFRRSHFGFFIKKLNKNITDFQFTDFTAKFNFIIGKRDRLFLTLFSGKDAYIAKQNSTGKGLEWGNYSLTLRWNHVYGNRLFSNTTFYASNFDYALYTDYENKTYWNSHIQSTNLKSEFTWYYNLNSKIKYGFNLSGYFFNPGNFISDDASSQNRVSQANSSELVLYAGNEQKIARWLWLNYGLRISNWSNYGEAFSIVYDENYNPVSQNSYSKGERYYSNNNIEPRISLSIKTGSLSSIKLSYNRPVQYINLINNSISPLNSLEVWLPSGPNIKHQYADVYNAGYIKEWPKIKVDLSADIYCKRMYNQIGYSPHAEMFLNPYIEGELRQGDGYAYGFEFALKKTAGKLSGQIAYGYNRSFLQINGLNNNKRYPAHQDKPVDFSFVLDYRIKPGWTINLNILYASGMAISIPTGFYYYRGTQVPYYSSINNDRFPDYKRIDLSSVWRLNKTERTFEHYITLTLYNIFSIHNYAFLYFSKTTGDDGKFYIPADTSNPSELVTTYRYIYSFIPSLSYNLKF